MAERFRAGGYGYGDAKKELLRVYDETLAPFRERRAHFEAHPDEVRDILAAGAAKARAEAASPSRSATASGSASAPLASEQT